MKQLLSQYERNVALPGGVWQLNSVIEGLIPEDMSLEDKFHVVTLSRLLNRDNKFKAEPETVVELCNLGVLELTENPNAAPKPLNYLKAFHSQAFSFMSLIAAKQPTYELAIQHLDNSRPHFDWVKNNAPDALTKAHTYHNLGESCFSIASRFYKHDNPLFEESYKALGSAVQYSLIAGEDGYSLALKASLHQASCAETAYNYSGKAHWLHLAINKNVDLASIQDDKNRRAKSLAIAGKIAILGYEQTGDPSFLNSIIDTKNYADAQDMDSFGLEDAYFEALYACLDCKKEL